MFKRINQQQLLRRKVKDIGEGRLNKVRILDSIPLRQLSDSQSMHSSVFSQSRHSSIKNLANASIASSEFTMRSSMVKSQSSEKKKVHLSKEQSIEQLLLRYYSRPFTKSLVHYLNKDWSKKERQLWQAKKIQNFVSSVMQRSNWLKDMINEFMEKEYGTLGADAPIIMSLLFKEAIHSIQDLEGVIPEIIKKIPDQRLYRQESILEQLNIKLLEIYDPKCLYSNLKIKQRLHMYLQQYTIKKNDLKTDLCTKIIPNMEFLQNAEDYLSTYQKEIIKLKAQIGSLQAQKSQFQLLLSRKKHFSPLQVDYQQLYSLKEQSNKQIRNDLDNNIVLFHEDKHKRNQSTIEQLQKAQLELRDDNDTLKEEVEKLKDQIMSWQKNKPLFREFGAQVYLIAQGKGSQGAGGHGGTLMSRFLDNVVTPFSFNRDVAGSLINILTIDKVLFDYEIIRTRDSLKSFQDYMFQWFIIRTGCRKIAQIFVKNFLYSLKELKSNHKRFALFYRICGHSGFKKRNLQQDLQGIFFTTHLCWYYLIKLALMYRKRLNENPTGYHIFPPLPCEQVFKLPLRKVYELVEQFFASEEIEIPVNLTQRIDHYCINEISKFKSGDQQFQKEIMQQIHILRDINFDLIAGFILEYIANLKCEVVEKLLRTIDSKQQQDGNILGYTEFQVIYRRYYKQRKAKIQLIYSKLCMVNQHDMLDVENMQPVVLNILEDSTPLRSIFQKLQPLKALILSDKVSLMRNQKKVLNQNSYQNFRERYYCQFYDFYNTTAFLQEVFKIVKSLVKKRLKKTNIAQNEIAKLVQSQGESLPRTGNRDPDQDQSNSQEGEDQGENKRKREKRGQVSGGQVRDGLVGKLQEWGKIMSRVPHFVPRVLTIDQIIIHNMRRKQMIDASQYAWRTLRQILINLAKE